MLGWSGAEVLSGEVPQGVARHDVVPRGRCGVGFAVLLAVAVLCVRSAGAHELRGMAGKPDAAGFSRSPRVRLASAKPYDVLGARP